MNAIYFCCISKKTKMKKSYLALAAIFTISLTFAFAGSNGPKSETPPVQLVDLSGVVIDFETGEALTGVEVYIEDLDQKVYTDFDGRFTFENVKEGEYDIVASYISYDKSLIENFETNTISNEVDIKLQPAK